MSAVACPPALVIAACSTAHKVLLALRPGAPTEKTTLVQRCGPHVYAAMLHLDRAGYIERVTGGVNNTGAWYQITAAGREACPPRRGNFAGYPDFSTTPLGDLS